MDISLTEPMTWIVVLVAPILVVALRWSLRRRRVRGPDRERNE